jgi:hypothetical protein
MNAAALALDESGHLFPQLNHQKSIVNKTSNRKWQTQSSSIKTHNVKKY